MDLEKKEIIFSTKAIDTFSRHFIGMSHLQNEGFIYQEIDKFQFFMQIIGNYAYIGILPFGGHKLGWDYVYLQKANKNDGIEMISNFSSIIEKYGIESLLQENSILNKKNSNPVYNYLANNAILDKIINEPCMTKEEIRLIGLESSGLSTIFFLWFGLTISGSHADTHIPYNKKLNIKLKKFNVGRGNQLFYGKILPNELNIIYIVDSTDKKHVSKNSMLIHYLNKSEVNQNILILANKQDLHGAISPEEIENIMGYPTMGFSAIAPDASEQLEKIISDFLINNN